MKKNNGKSKSEQNKNEEWITTYFLKLRSMGFVNSIGKVFHLLPS